MNPFEYTTDEHETHAPKRSRGFRMSFAALWVWFSSAVFVGAFAAGILLLVLVRFYVKESIADAIKKKPNNTVDTRPHTP